MRSGRTASRTGAPATKLPAARSGPNAVSTVTMPWSLPTTVPARREERPTKSSAKAVAGRAVDFLRCRQMLDRALVHDGDAVGHGERLVLVVRHEHRGGAEFAQQATQLDLHGLAQLAIEGGEGLVEQQQLGPDRQRAGDGDALLLAARQCPHRAVGEVGEMHQLEEALHGRRDVGGGALAGLQAEGHVLGDGEMREQRVVLEDDADVAPVRRLARDVLAVEPDRAAIGRQQTRRRCAATWSCRSPRDPAARRTRRRRP